MAFHGLVGDVTFRQDLFKMRINVDQAMGITRDVSHCMGWGDKTIRVIFSGRKTRRFYGRCEHEKGTNNHFITLHRIGENVGTLLHELAHVEQSGHKQPFKNVHAAVVWIFDTLTRRYDCGKRT